MKSDKIAQKLAKQKSLNERAAIADEIKSKMLSELGIDIDTFESEGMQAFSKVLHEYGTDPLPLSGYTGKILIKEIDRYICYILPLSKHACHAVMLQAP